MSGNVVVKLDNVSKYYKLYNSPKDRLKEALHPFRKKYHKEFFALNNISLELRKGQCLGIIGKNGMGKSTLLKIIANVIQPSSGSVQINGSVSALLELGTGFNPEFTGMENIYFYGTILGFRKNEVENRVKEIVDFADIGEFINQPVKTYSSGMFVRLAFAVQTSLKPDILLVDEVLSVGDIFFQQKCHARIEELLSRGTALILVSHDTQMIEKYSSSVLLLENGENICIGNPHSTIQYYYSLPSKQKLRTVLNHIEPEYDSPSSENTEERFAPQKEWPPDNYFMQTSELSQFGDKSVAEIIRVCVCNFKREPSLYFNVGDKVLFYYDVEVKKNIGIPVGAVILINSLNIVIHGKDSMQYRESGNEVINAVRENSSVRFMQSFKLNIAPGEYTFSLGFGTIDAPLIEAVKKADCGEREDILNQLVRIPQAGKLIINHQNGNITLPFHGYTDLEGDCKVFINS